MAGRPAKIRQRDLKQALMAAQKAGLDQVKVDFGDGISITFPLVPDDEEPAADNSNNSFDKIMRKP